MAAGALFALLLGLVLVIFMIVVIGSSSTSAVIAFTPFLFTGVLCFAASALIKTAVVKAVLTAWNPTRQGNPS